jgi:hypothetical protein
MKKPTKARKTRPPRAPSESQLAGLKASTAARRLATVERLQTAIGMLKEKKQAITVQAIYEECGLRYAAIYRNPDALTLFRANSTHLVAKRKRSGRKRGESSESALLPRDSLLSYKKPQLVNRLRSVQQQLFDVQQQLAVQAEASVKREACIAALEARLAELEPYRAFVEQMRVQMYREEQGRFGALPPGI